MYSPCSGTIACCPPRVLPSSPVSNSYLRHLGRWSTPALFPLLDIFRLNAPEIPDRSASYVCASQQPSTGVFSLSYDLPQQVIRDPCEHEAAAWHIPALTVEDTHSSPLGGWRSTHIIKRSAAISRTQFLNVQTETHQDTPVKGKLLTAVMGEEQSDTDPNPGFIGKFIGGV